MGPEQYLINFGVLGIILILILARQLVPGWEYRKSEEENEKLKSALELERQRNNMLQQLAVTGARAMTAIAEVAEEQRGTRAGPRGDDGAHGSGSRRAITPPGGIPVGGDLR